MNKILATVALTGILFTATATALMAAVKGDLWRDGYLIVGLGSMSCQQYFALTTNGGDGSFFVWGARLHEWIRYNASYSGLPN